MQRYTALEWPVGEGANAEVSSAEGCNADMCVGVRAAGRPRPGGGITLKLLIDEGILFPGENVLTVEYKSNITYGSLADCGRIKCTIGGTELTFESPSAFSIYLKRLINPARKADDGWKTVKFEGKVCCCSFACNATLAMQQNMAVLQHCSSCLSFQLVWAEADGVCIALAAVLGALQAGAGQKALWAQCHREGQLQPCSLYGC